MEENVAMLIEMAPYKINEDSFSLITKIETTSQQDLFMNRLTKEVFSIKEKAIQEGLIKLGWTPPKTYIPRLSARKDLYILRNYIHNWLRKSKTHKEERLAAIAALEGLEKFVKGKYDATD
jgi:hypothetical protein